MLITNHIVCLFCTEKPEQASYIIYTFIKIGTVAYIKTAGKQYTPILQHN